jgi:hypothetical protein
LIAGKLNILRKGVVEKGQLGVRETCSFTLTRITKELDLDWLISQSIFSQQAHDLVQAIARWAVFMEEVTGEEDKVYLRRLRGYQQSVFYNPHHF